MPKMLNDIKLFKGIELNLLKINVIVKYFSNEVNSFRDYMKTIDRY